MSSKKLQPSNSLKLSGNIKARKDISAVTKVGSYLAIGVDEGVGETEDENVIQVLKEVNSEHYEVNHEILLFKGSKEEGKELDIEGIDVEGDTMYVVGSHSLRRKRIKSDKKYAKNREKLRDEKIDHQKNRDWLYRVTIDSNVNASNLERISLRDIINTDEVLKTFSKIPSKENGVDIEGITVKGEWLYVGFRGPVFRGNYVPVMKFKFEEPQETYELLYVQLGGRGCRDIVSVSDGFLIVAGPIGGGSASYELYYWDGKDTIIGDDRADEDIGKVELLGEIPTPEEGKAEGLAVVEEGSTYYDVIIVYDGVENNVAQCFRVDKSQ